MHVAIAECRKFGLPYILRSLILCRMWSRLSCECSLHRSWIGPALSVCLSVCLFVCLSIRLAACPSVCLLLSVSVCLSAYLSTCVYRCLSLYTLHHRRSELGDARIADGAFTSGPKTFLTSLRDPHSSVLCGSCLGMRGLPINTTWKCQECVSKLVAILVLHGVTFLLCGALAVFVVLSRLYVCCYLNSTWQLQKFVTKS
jgi:hypothetical protein